MFAGGLTGVRGGVDFIRGGAVVGPIGRGIPDGFPTGGKFPISGKAPFWQTGGAEKLGAFDRPNRTKPAQEKNQN